MYFSLNFLAIISPHLFISKFQLMRGSGETLVNTVFSLLQEECRNAQRNEKKKLNQNKPINE